MSQYVVELKNIEKSYSDRKILSQLNLTIEAGQVFGFLGPNGAGKSTTIKIMSGLLKADQGEVKILGLDPFVNKKLLSSSIGLLPENPPLYMDMKVIEYLEFAALIQGVKKKEIKTKVADVVERLDLTDVATRLIGHLSKGYKQRIAIAQAIVHQPKIIFLDEPTVGLDPESNKELREFIKALRNNHTILISSHQLSEIENICTHIGIINKGMIIAAGPTYEVIEKFKGVKNIFLTLESWSDGWISQIEKLGYEVQIVDQFYPHRIKVKLKIISDQRKDLLDFLVKCESGIIEFYEDKNLLEELFINLVHGANNDVSQSSF